MAIATQRQMTMTEVVQQALIDYHKRQWYRVRTIRATINSGNVDE